MESNVCIHGLDKNNCPTCRIIKSTIPINIINKLDLKNKSLEPSNPFFEKNLASKKDFEKDLLLNQNKIHPNLIQSVPEPNLIGTIPNFENKLFHERLAELKLETRDLKKENMEKHEIKLDDK